MGANSLASRPESKGCSHWQRPADLVAWRHARPACASLALAFAMLHMLRAPFVGLDHPGRAFLAVTAYARYEGIPDPEQLDRALTLLEPDARRDAIRLGLALRLAYTISGGARDILALARLEMDRGSPRLVLPDEIRVPGGDAVERRFNALARSFDAAGARILS